MEFLLLWRGEVRRLTGQSFLWEITSYSRSPFYRRDVSEVISYLQENQHLLEDDDLLQEIAWACTKYNLTCPDFKYMCFTLGRILKDQFINRTKLFHNTLFDGEAYCIHLEVLPEREVVVDYVAGFNFLLYGKEKLPFRGDLFSRYWFYTRYILGISQGGIGRLLTTAKRNVRRRHNSFSKELLLQLPFTGNSNKGESNGN